MKDATDPPVVPPLSKVGRKWDNPGKGRRRWDNLSAKGARGSDHAVLPSDVSPLMDGTQNVPLFDNSHDVARALALDYR